MTKIEMKRKELDLIEALINTVYEKYEWDCFYYDSTFQEMRKRDDANPDLVSFYEGWITKLEKMI